MKTEETRLRPNDLYPTGVIAAMNEELGELLADKAGCEARGLLPMRSGVGKVNAAALTERLINGFHGQQAKRIIVIGTAGGLVPDLKPGDLVVSSSTRQHDVDVTALGFGVMEIPFEPISQWEADPILRDAAISAARDALHLHIRVAKILTGDSFVNKPKDALWLRYSGGTCLDMETAAVAQVCAFHQVPWVSIRVISDLVDSSSPIDFPALLPLAAERLKRIVFAMFA